MTWLSVQLAGRVTLALLALALAFHVLVLTGVVPFEVTWGGRLKTREDMLRFETVSLVVNVVLLAVVGARVREVTGWPRRVVTGALWVMTLVFALNTVANCFAESPVERFVATPLTLVLSLCAARLAMTFPPRNPV